MQRIAGKTFIAFSALTFSLVARAQLIEIDPPAADVVDTADAPVAVTKSMRPSTVPSAGLVNTGTGITDDGSSSDEGGSVNAAGNSNGPGTQINLNIQNDQAAKNAADNAALNGDGGRLSELRMEKKLREKINEERMAEKIEEDRIHGEQHRTKGIERFDFGTRNGDGLETVPVTSAGAGASASAGPGGASATAVATVSTDGSHTGSGIFGFDTQFKLSPVIGYRWFQDAQYSQYRPQNVLVGGVGLEGVIGRYLSVEGNFLYGRDNFGMQYYGAAPYASGYGYGGAGYAPGYGQGGYGYATYANLPLRSRDSFEVAGGVKLGYDVSMVRPFVAFGVGGLFQKYNIDDAYTTESLRQIGLARSTTHFTLMPGAGLDFSVANNMSLGARFDYQYITNRYNQNYTAMDAIWGDARNRYRLTGSLQLVF